MVGADGQKKFLLSLREFRPELAEFLMHCERATVTQAERNFAYMRARYLAGEGRAQGYEAVAAAAGLLELALHDRRDPMRLASLTRDILDAAMKTLTFQEHAPVTPAESFIVHYENKPVVLVADDDRIVREMMRQLFADTMDLQIAENGQQAYAMIQRQIPDFLILDDFMPGMTGLKLIETLHASPAFRTIPVLMLTASDRPRDVERAIQAGAVDYVMKPFHPKLLAEKVHGHIRKLIS